MEVVSSKGKESQAKSKESSSSNRGLSLTMLEEKVIRIIELMKTLKEENVSLKNTNKDLQVQLKALEGSLVSETKDLEELSQEKMMTKMVVDNLLHLIEIQEQ